MAEISATVVTLNEEENIRDCLETLTWCDEIIVVDSYSEDRTVEIAEEYTEKIFTYKRTGYVEPVRKKAVAEASGDWICMVDADERVPDCLASKLARMAEEDSTDVIYAPRRNYMMGEWVNNAGWWPDYRPILYRPSVIELSSEIHNPITVHNTANKKHLEANKTNSIIHFNYTGINDFISRMNRYTDIEAEQSEFKLWRIITAPAYEFVNRFIRKKGYKLGLLGFFLSVFMSWYRLLTIAKAWQYDTKGSKSEINDKYTSLYQNETEY